MKKMMTTQLFAILGIMVLISGCMKSKSESIQAWKAEGKSTKIIKLIHDPVQGIRLEAINALAEMGAKDAIKPLGGLFNDSDKVVVHEAIDAIVEIGGPEIEPYMLEAIKLDTVPARTAAAIALGNLKSSDAVDALIITLDEYKFPDLVLAAIKSLGQIADPKAVDPLCKKLEDRSYSIREESINSLRLIGSDAAAKGIATCLGDVNEKIRQSARKGLLDCGAVSVPYTIEVLRDEDYLARESALIVLKELDAVPESGSDGVWFHLAELTAVKEPVVDPLKADVFRRIDDRVPVLVEALVHAAPAVREYACIALEDLDVDATNAVLSAVEEQTGEQALKWFEQRSGWSGAPSWKYDLWAATTALNPKFNYDVDQVDFLAQSRVNAEQMMSSENFRPRRENVPALLLQLKGTDSNDDDVIDQVKRCQALALKHLKHAGYQAVFPLIAALNSDDPEIAMQSARILNQIADERTTKLIVDEYKAQLGLLEKPVIEPEGEEAEPAPEQRNPVEELSGTSLHLALIELNMEELKPLRLKIRPVDAQAVFDFNQKFEGVQVVTLPLGVKVDPALNAVPFRLSYYKNGQMNELRVIYRKNEQKNWVIQPPLPDALP